MFDYTGQVNRSYDEQQSFHRTEWAILKQGRAAYRLTFPKPTQETQSMITKIILRRDSRTDVHTRCTLFIGEGISNPTLFNCGNLFMTHAEFDILTLLLRAGCKVVANSDLSVISATGEKLERRDT